MVSDHPVETELILKIIVQAILVHFIYYHDLSMCRVITFDLTFFNYIQLCAINLKFDDLLINVSSHLLINEFEIRYVCSSMCDILFYDI